MMDELHSYNDQALLQEIATGSEAAFRRLFDLHEKKMLAYAQKFTQSREEAQDILQDVFLKIWTRRTALTEIKAIEAYLQRSIYNASMSFLRQHARIKLVQSQLAGEAAGVEEPSRQLLSKEIRLHIQQLVDQLSPKQREVFVLNRELGLKPEEIGHRLGIATNTVRNHLAEALKFLRQELSGQYGPLSIAIYIIYRLGNF